MKRIAVILGAAIAALAAPSVAGASGIIGDGLGSSPGSVRPATGVIVNGFGTSPRALYPHAGVIAQRSKGLPIKWSVQLTEDSRSGQTLYRLGNKGLWMQ